MTHWRRAKPKCLHEHSLVRVALNLTFQFTVITLIWIVFLGYFRFEISDNGRSEGSEDTLPNETTVKFISEVSSKVCLPFRVAFVCPVVWRTFVSRFYFPKTKTKSICSQSGQSDTKYTDNPMNQSKLQQNACSRLKRGKRASKSRLVLVLLLIGWKSGANFLANSVA